MVTRLGTRLGTTLGTDLGSFSDTPPVVYPTISALLPPHRYRVAQAATSGGNVTNVPNEGSAGGQLNVADGVLAAPAVDAALNGALTVAFTGTQSLSPSQAISTWTKFHNGGPFTLYVVADLTTGNFLVSNFASATVSAGIRCAMAATTAGNMQISNGVNSPAPIQIVPASGNWLGAHIAKLTFSGTSAAFYRDGASLVTGTVTNTLSSADAIYTLSIGRVPAGGFATGAKFAELLLFDRLLSAAEQAAVDAEMFAAYGKHA